MGNGLAVFERLFVLETKKDKTEIEMEEYNLLKKLETKREKCEYEEDEEEYIDEAERVGMVQTVYGWM